MTSDIKDVGFTLKISEKTFKHYVGLWPKTIFQIKLLSHI